MNTQVDKFFVYGTLRPDITAPWSDSVHKNKRFKLKYYEAFLSHSKLFFHVRIGYPMTIYDPDSYLEDDITIGYILETDNIDETLKLFDEIEDYPNEYDRLIVNCFNKDLLKEERVYFYSLKRNRIEKEDLIDLNINDFKLFSYK